MSEAGNDRQLGDFIKGRLLFIEAYCQEQGLDKEKALAAAQDAALRLAGTPEREQFLKDKVFSGVVLASAYFPEWVDGVFLEAMTVALKGPGAPLYTTSSRRPCITSEAGRFNAHRQAETVFKAFFQGKKPQDWLKYTFLSIYRQCYGVEAASKFSVEEAGPGHFKVTVDNRGLGKASRMDCSTGVGYLYGALEQLGALNIVVTHDQCGADEAFAGKLCVFDVTWT